MGRAVVCGLCSFDLLGAHEELVSTVRLGPPSLFVVRGAAVTTLEFSRLTSLGFLTSFGEKIGVDPKERCLGAIGRF